MKLLRLLPNLMNLYGDYGNLRVLEGYLAKNQVECQEAVWTTGEEFSPEDVGFIHLGPGTEPARNKALELLRPVAPLLKEALEAGVPMLFTGNAFTLLGKTILTADGEELEGLGLAEFTVSESWERYTGDAVALRADDPEGPATVGFLNKCDQIFGVDSPLFTMKMGTGNSPDDPAEGYHAKNLYATHLIGPLLVKNPHLLGEIGALLGAERGPEPVAEEATLAYRVTLEALEKRMD